MQGVVLRRRAEKKKGGGGGSAAKKAEDYLAAGMFDDLEGQPWYVAMVIMGTGNVDNLAQLSDNTNLLFIAKRNQEVPGSLRLARLYHHLLQTPQHSPQLKEEALSLRKSLGLDTRAGGFNAFVSPYHVLPPLPPMLQGVALLRQWLGSLRPSPCSYHSTCTSCIAHATIDLAILTRALEGGAFVAGSAYAADALFEWVEKRASVGDLAASYFEQHLLFSVQKGHRRWDRSLGFDCGVRASDASYVHRKSFIIFCAPDSGSAAHGTGASARAARDLLLAGEFAQLFEQGWRIALIGLSTGNVPTLSSATNDTVHLTFPKEGCEMDAQLPLARLGCEISHGGPEPRGLVKYATCLLRDTVALKEYPLQSFEALQDSVPWWFDRASDIMRRDYAQSQPLRARPCCVFLLETLFEYMEGGTICVVRQCNLRALWEQHARGYQVCLVGSQVDIPVLVRRQKAAFQVKRLQAQVDWLCDVAAVPLRVFCFPTKLETDDRMRFMWEVISGAGQPDRRVAGSEKPGEATLPCIPCHLCGKTFTVLRNLNSHLREQHSTSPPAHTCHLCGKTFPVSRYLNRHLREQHSTSPTAHTCHLCGRPFRRRSNLIRHLRVCARSASGGFERPDPPPSAAAPEAPAKKRKMQRAVSRLEMQPKHQALPAAAAAEAKLSRHLRVSHTTPPPAETCNLCGKTFTTKEQLKCHVLYLCHNQNYGQLKCPEPDRNWLDSVMRQER